MTNRRLIPTILAVLLGVAFLTATLILSATMKTSITAHTAGSVEGADAVITATGSTTIPIEAVRSISDASGITGVAPAISSTVRTSRNTGEMGVEAHITPALNHGTRLVSGRMPTAGGTGSTVAEAVVNPLMTDAGVKPGTTMTIIGAGRSSTPRTVRVVGVIAPGPRASLNSGNKQIYTDASTLMAALGVKGYDAVYVTGSGGQDAVVATVNASLSEAGVKPTTVTVRSADAERDWLTSQSLRGMGQLTGMMSAFAAIAIAVAAIVIVNTFTILVTQRTRALALARCVGATRAQVRRSVLVEALFTGLIGSLLGLAAGAGLAQLLVTLGGRSANIPMVAVITVTPVSLVLPIGIGTLVTVLAALPPARRATRVPPVAALSPLPAVEGRTASRLRLMVGGALVALGAASLILGSVAAERLAGSALLWGVAGGLVSFIGVLVLTVALIPQLSLWLGRLVGRVGGVPAELATENTQRNPHRAAATASALLVGVTLIVTMAVGAATAQASGNKAIDQQFPTDAVVTSDSGAVSDGLLTAVAGAGGVERAGLITSGKATMVPGGSASSGSASSASGSGQQVEVQGYSQQALAAIRDTSRFAGLDDRHAVVEVPGLRNGEVVTLVNGQHRVQLTAVVSAEGSGRGSDAPSTVAITKGTMERLLPAAQGSQILVRYAQSADSAQVTSAITRAISTTPGASVIAVAETREQIQQVVTIMLGLVVGLLAISVLIALVGVGNTLGLSVVERTREIGLLRALGLTRRQVRAMFGQEAVLESLAAAILGVLLGGGYGIGGSYALLGGLGMDVVVSVPWAQLGAAAVIAIAAGWLASVIPGRHAARISPATALAGE